MEGRGWAGGLRRVLPAVGLFFLAPLIAEYLLGDIPITQLGALVLLAPLYGGGALLIREVARRTGRGWPAIAILALAYGVLEEGIVTMSLFNPNYVGARLLDNGFIPQLGIAGPWTVFVLTLHVVWSICTPIALVELLADGRGATPWLGRAGLSIVAALFVLGVAGNTLVSVVTFGYVAPVPQLVAAGAIAILLVALVMAVPASWSSAAAASGSAAPSPWLVGALSFVASGIARVMPMEWSPWLVVGAHLLLAAGALFAIAKWAGRVGWADAHRLALAAGPVLTYAWHAFPQHPVLEASPEVDLIGNIVFASAALVLLVVTGLQLRSRGAGQVRHTRAIHNRDAA